MAKNKTRFVCQQCGYVTPKWLGKCPECGTWDSFVEEVAVATPNKTFLAGCEKAVPTTISKVTKEKVERITTHVGEFDRVLGGGIVPGSLILLAGSPGIGKSTIALDVGMQVAAGGRKVLYVSGEESEAQTAMRAERLGKASDNLLIMTATELTGILLQGKALNPCLLVIDSIQTMYNSQLETAAGSVGQVRECTADLLRFAKESNIAVMIIGHVTKEGNIAGPRLLEHMVDVVLQFEGEKSYAFRVLRAVKNRFGSTEETGIFSMEAEGLKEVVNPSGLFLEKKDNILPGSAITAVMEGNRPILTEIQALVARTPFGLPRRTAVGIDFNRVNILLAVLEKRVGMNFGMEDAYVCALGGMKITEPAADLAIVAALVSSFRNTPLTFGSLCLGEVGLTGELRPINAVERRIKEGRKLGFSHFVVPKNSMTKALEDVKDVYPVSTVEEALSIILPQ